jgi:hypothetical protein
MGLAHTVRSVHEQRGHIAGRADDHFGRFHRQPVPIAYHERIKRCAPILLPAGGPDLALAGRAGGFFASWFVCSGAGDGFVIQRLVNLKAYAGFIAEHVGGRRYDLLAELFAEPIERKAIRGCDNQVRSAQAEPAGPTEPELKALFTDPADQCAAHRRHDVHIVLGHVPTTLRENRSRIRHTLAFPRRVDSDPRCDFPKTRTEDFHGC